jgi:hypothetical protein
VVAFMVVGNPTIASAQVTRVDWPPVSSLNAGDTVRVWASAPPLSGRTALVARVGGDTLALSDLPGRRSLGAVAVPFRSLARIEVQRGQRRSAGWTAAGIVLGLAGGALIGSVTGVMLECGGSCSGQGDLEGILGFVVGGGLGALAGGVVGGIIGGQRRPGWQPLSLPPR